MCEKVWFDKTTDLNNYPVEMATASLMFNLTLPGGKVVYVDGLSSVRDYLNIIWHKLKANYTYTFYDEVDAGYMYDENNTTGKLHEILHGKYDLRAIDDYQAGIWKNEIILFGQSRICFITKKKVLSITEQLSHLFPMYVQLMLLIIFVANTFLLAYLMKSNYSATAVDVFRAILGTSMLHEPKSYLGRIIVASFIYSLMIINMYLQSQLNAMLTITSVEQDDIRNACDLLLKGYKVYYRPHKQQFYLGTCLHNNNKFVDHVLECIGWIERDDKVACIEDCEFISFHSLDYEKFNIKPDELFSNKYYSILLKNDSPLYNRLNTLILELYEQGIIQFLYAILKLRYEKRFSTDYKDISLSQLEFTFYLIFIGHLLAIITFIIEFFYKSTYHKILLLYNKWLIQSNIGCLRTKQYFRKIPKFAKFQRIFKK